MFSKGREELLAASPAELAQHMKAHAPDADLTFLTDEACLAFGLLSADMVHLASNSPTTSARPKKSVKCL